MTHDAELVGNPPGSVDELGETSAEELCGQCPVTDSGREDAQGCGEHGMAEIRIDPLQVEADGCLFDRGFQREAEGIDPTQGLRSRARDAALPRGEAVV